MNRILQENILNGLPHLADEVESLGGAKANYLANIIRELHQAIKEAIEKESE